MVLDQFRCGGWGGWLELVVDCGKHEESGSRASAYSPRDNHLAGKSFKMYLLGDFLSKLIRAVGWTRLKTRGL